MKNKWLGYLSSAILLLAGILELSINKILVGCLFIAAAIGAIIVQVVFSKKQKH